jgi:signal transduction histidine kinase
LNCIATTSRNWSPPARRSWRGQGGGGSRERGQERVPGQHEPRDPYPDERHHRPDPPAEAGRPDAGAGRPAGKVDTAANHLLAIINDILDVSKIEAGKLVLEEADFSLTSIFDQVRSLIFEQARAKGLAVEVDAGEVPVWLRGDPTRLRQALFNYTSNAIKFTERGSVTLRARLLEDGSDGLLLRFEVADTGIGIPAEKIQPCSTPSSRPTPRPRASTAAPASAWSSRGAWRN